MYLGAFPVGHDSHGGAVANEGIDPDDCRAAGGIPSYVDVPGAGMGPTRRVWTCQMPAASKGSGPAPSINVSVPTQVSSQVSPQISPVLAQQSNPQGSPVSASPAMTGASGAPSQSPGQTGPSSNVTGGGAAPLPAVGTIDQSPDPLTSLFADVGKQALDRLLNQAAPLPSSPVSAGEPAPAPPPSSPSQIVMGSGGDASAPAAAVAPIKAGMSLWQKLLLASIAGGFALTLMRKRRTIRRHRK